MTKKSKYRFTIASWAVSPSLPYWYHEAKWCANRLSYASSCGSSKRKIKSKRDNNVGGNWIFSIIVFDLFHCDSIGLAAAKTDVRAFNVHIIPALAIDNVCCS